MENSAVLPQRAVQTHVRRNKNGTIKVGAINKSSVVLKILVGALLLLTVYAFWIRKSSWAKRSQQPCTI